MTYTMSELLEQEARTVGSLAFFLRLLLDHVTDAHPLGFTLPDVIERARSVVEPVERQTPELHDCRGEFVRLLEEVRTLEARRAQEKAPNKRGARSLGRASSQTGV